ncbi:helix-turn-helix domain-containing protein [Streptomyces sp. NPDC000994]
MSRDDNKPPFTAEEFAERVIEMARRFEQTQAAQREDAKTTNARMIAAGMARREWKRVEDTLPTLIAEAHHENGWTVDHIAAVLDVSESYVYRVLRKHNAQQ